MERILHHLWCPKRFFMGLNNCFRASLVVRAPTVSLTLIWYPIAQIHGLCRIGGTSLRSLKYGPGLGKPHHHSNKRSVPWEIFQGVALLKQFDQISCMSSTLGLGATYVHRRSFYWFDWASSGEGVTKQNWMKRMKDSITGVRWASARLQYQNFPSRNSKWSRPLAYFNLYTYVFRFLIMQFFYMLNAWYDPTKMLWGWDNFHEAVGKLMTRLYCASGWMRSWMARTIF